MCAVPRAQANMSSDADTSHLIVWCGIIGILFSLWLLRAVSSVKLQGGDSREMMNLVERGSKSDQAWEQTERLHELYSAIRLGADSFLTAEYKMCAIFVMFSAPVIGVLIANGQEGGSGGVSPTQSGIFSAVAFTVGAVTSMVSGWIGMRVAVYSNARCTVGAIKSAPAGWTESFNTAFRAGGVMGFSLCGLALLCLYALLCFYANFFDPGSKASATHLMDAIAGFGLGGSAIAMFGRVGGGIYTKAADVGADLAGKVVEDLPEVDPPVEKASTLSEDSAPYLPA